MSTSSFTFLVAGISLLVFVVIAFCNAVNLTDGIDGLAAGLAVQCGLALVLASFYSDGIARLSTWTMAALAGACFGFLFFNKHKAHVFMGDTGSLAIGAALGAGAILQHAIFLLPFIGFIYFVEMLSVIVQVAWFKWTKKQTGEGKRLFRRAPLHHHFELCGWSEWRVVATFWAVNLFTSIVGLWLWKAGSTPALAVAIAECGFSDCGLIYVPHEAKALRHSEGSFTTRRILSRASRFFSRSFFNHKIFLYWK